MFNFLTSPALALLLSGDISGQNTITFGIGDELLDALPPIAKSGFYFDFSVATGVYESLDLITSFDFGLPQAGREAGGNSKLMFLGKLYETLRWQVVSVADSLKVGLDLGGGGYLSRHSQDRLPEKGSRYGGAVCGGLVVNYFPFVQSQYQWSDMFIQLRGQYWHYFNSKYLDRSVSMMIGFGGTF